MYIYYFLYIYFNKYPIISLFHYFLFMSCICILWFCYIYSNYWKKMICFFNGLDIYLTKNVNIIQRVLSITLEKTRVVDERTWISFCHFSKLLIIYLILFLFGRVCHWFYPNSKRKTYPLVKEDFSSSHFFLHQSKKLIHPIP